MVFARSWRNQTVRTPNGEIDKRRRISLSRKRPSRFTENVEWCGTLSSRSQDQR